ncbi:MAG: GLPGLI family protein [Sphingobacteriales bacterium]|nr:MAG: GLPGLI family protein [Sphingobacteriales bacterium]
MKQSSINLKYILLLLALWFALPGNLLAQQASFLTAGRVEYEKKINQHRIIEEEGEENFWVAEQKKWLTKVTTDFYELKFNDHRSSFKLLRENTDNKYFWGAKPSDTDVAVQDLQNQRVIIQRDVFENTYLITDSMRTINWRITNETRTIAGFECKKAVGVICDSVYVVAFYTDEIIASTGPESIGGLPGLILGLAVPRLHTTWFATKVELTTPAETELTPKQKGKKITYRDLVIELNKGVKDWGKEGAKRIWAAVL